MLKGRLDGGVGCVGVWQHARTVNECEAETNVRCRGVMYWLIYDIVSVYTQNPTRTDHQSSPALSHCSLLSLSLFTFSFSVHLLSKVKCRGVSFCMYNMKVEQSLSANDCFLWLWYWTLLVSRGYSFMKRVWNPLVHNRGHRIVVAGC